MWSILKPRPLGSIPMRRFTLFVSAMLVALFTILTAQTIPAQAQESTDLDVMVTWSGDNLEVASWTLERASNPANEDSSVPSLDETPCESSDNVYRSAPEIHESGSHVALVVACLDDSYDGNKTEAIPVTVLTYTASPDAESIEEFELDESIGARETEVAPEGLTGIVTRTPKGEEAGATESTSTCDGEGTKGVGWFVCPITRWLASGMDALFGILEGFLVVAPLSTNTDSPLFTMWRIMQNFANILFIVGFLIIIYSQTTSFGLSNYGLKRLLPRLIIAAVLVNISYWIAAAAVDLSNILGASLYDLLTGIGDTVQENSASDIPFESITWSNVAGVVLSAGAGGAAIFGVAAGVMATAGGSLWLLLVVLAGVMVSALVAILVLAARQALITILIVISPLAFVAYLLPSTEKYFDRWRGLFTTMLLLYPMVSVVFGGAQLAGMVIIYGALDSLKNNPNDPNFFNVLILGMVVQVAPVVITPLLIRLGGSLLGRIAGIVNDPNKGIIDRTRKFAQNRSDMTKNRQLWDWNPERKQYRNNNPLAAYGRWNALREKNNTDKLKAWEGGVDTAYARSSQARETHTQRAINEMRQKAGEDEAKAHFDQTIANLDNVRSLYYEQRQMNDKAETENKRVSSMYEGLKASPEVVARNAIEREIGDRSKELDRDVRALTSREATAKQVQEQAYNKLITDAASIKEREFAGFNEIDPQGIARIVNIAQETEAKRYETLVEAGRRTLLREEATIEELNDLIKTGRSSNAKFAHFSGDIESKAAAIRVFMEKAPMRMRHDLAAEMDLSVNAPRGSDAGVFRSEIAGGLAKNKPFHISQTFLNQMAEGRLDPIYNDIDGRNRMVLDTLDKFAFDADAMTSIDQDDIGAIAEFFEKSPHAATLNADARRQIINSLEEAFTSERYKGRMGKRRSNLNRIRVQLGLPPIRQ